MNDNMHSHAPHHSIVTKCDREKKERQKNKRKKNNIKTNVFSPIHRGLHHHTGTKEIMEKHVSIHPTLSELAPRASSEAEAAYQSPYCWQGAHLALIQGVCATVGSCGSASGWHSHCFGCVPSHRQLCCSFWQRGRYSTLHIILL